MRDLLLLVADVNTEKVIQKMLDQPNKLEIREIDYEIYHHPEHDPGCCTNSVSFMRPFCKEYRYAMVVFDYVGCGRESERPTELEKCVQDELTASGWGERVQVIIINPELENWFWSDSPHVESVLGWNGKNGRLRHWLQMEGRWPENQ